MWVHKEKYSENAKILLHDCIATHVSINDGALHFNFKDGFWILTTNDNNIYGSTFRSDLSQLIICNFAVEAIYIFREFRLLRRLISTKRIEIMIETLVDHINTGKWQLEFLSEYHTHRGVLFQCCLWMNQKPCRKDCQIVIQCDDIEYDWNNMCPDKPW